MHCPLLTLLPSAVALCPNAADITNNWLPLWLAPNLITLMGLWALLAAYALGVKYLPEFAGPAPAWLPAVKCAGAVGGCGVWYARFCVGPPGSGLYHGGWHGYCSVHLRHW